MNFITLDISALIGYTVAYDEETCTAIYFHVDELPSVNVLRFIKQFYPNATILITDSIDNARRHMGVCNAFRDVLKVAGEPVDRILLNDTHSRFPKG